MKITIRIPVVVSPEGDWYAHGDKSYLAANHDDLIRRFKNGEARYWIEAEVETPAAAPAPTTVKAKADGAS